MSVKKEIFHNLLSNFLGKARQDPRWIKKIALFTIGSGLLLMISFGFILYFSVSMAKELIAKKPDMDLLAIEQLIASKSLLLNEEQQRLIAPIIGKLATAGLTQEQAGTLKTQLLNTISTSQLAQIEAWKSSATKKAGGLFAVPPAIATFIENFTGLSKETVMAKVDAFRTWWQLSKPENSAEQLHKTIQNL